MDDDRIWWIVASDYYGSKVIGTSEGPDYTDAVEDARSMGKSVDYYHRPTGMYWDGEPLEKWQLKTCPHCRLAWEKHIETHKGETR